MSSSKPDPDHTYRCQFCGKEAPVSEWGRGGDECPACKRMYDAQLAQDEESE